MVIKNKSTKKVTLIQVNRNKSSIKGYKTLSVSVKQSKSKSSTSKQKQIKCKRI